MFAGYMPLNWRLEEKLFRAYALPDARGWSDYVIYFTIIPDGTLPYERSDFPRNGILSQFTLCHPGGYEWHTDEGVRAPASS